MSDSKTSLASRLWQFGLSLLGCVVCVWVAIQLVIQIWWVLAIIAGVLAVVTALTVAVRWWLRSRRW